MSETTINLPESLTIHHIETQYGNLKISFQSITENLKINASQVEAIDTSGLQVLLALINYATSSGKTIHWEDPTEVLSASAKQIGLTKKLQLS